MSSSSICDNPFKSERFSISGYTSVEFFTGEWNVDGQTTVLARLSKSWGLTNPPIDCTDMKRADNKFRHTYNNVFAGYTRWRFRLEECKLELARLLPVTPDALQPIPTNNVKIQLYIKMDYLKRNIQIMVEYLVFMKANLLPMLLTILSSAKLLRENNLWGIVAAYV